MYRCRRQRCRLYDVCAKPAQQQFPIEYVCCANADTDCDSNGYINAHSEPDTHRNGDSYSYGNCHTNCNCNIYTDGNSDAWFDCKIHAHPKDALETRTATHCAASFNTC